MPFINRSPLNYGVNTESSIRIFEDNRAPTTNDYKNFIVGDEWWDTSSQDFWKLVFKTGTSGTWRKMAGTAAAVEFFTPDVGGQVGPDAANNINLLGGGGITTTGTPGTNTITIAPSGGGSLIETLTGDAGGAVGPDGTATINVVGGAGITTTGNPGTNTLTIALTGGGTAIDTITGNAGGAVPPDATGNFNLVGTATSGIYFTGNPVTFTQTASLNSPYADGDFEFRNTTAATPRTLSITNTDANAASFASLLVQSEPLGGDAFTTYSINGTQSYTLGIDNSDSDFLKLTTGASPSAGTELFVRNATQANFYGTGLQNIFGTAGTTGTITSSNTDNTNAASHAQVDAITGGASGGDPLLHLAVSGAAERSFGIDNSDSDTLKITTGATPSAGTTHWFIDSSGRRRIPLQPRFFATRTSTVNNVTGAGTAYQVIFDGEIYDIGGNYDNTTGVFTAPIDGLYLLQTQVRITGCTVAISAATVFRFSAGSPMPLEGTTYRPASNLDIIVTNFVLDYMTAGSTVYVEVNSGGEAGDTNDLYGDANRRTYFQGCLLF